MSPADDNKDTSTNTEANNAEVKPAEPTSAPELTDAQDLHVEEHHEPRWLMLIIYFVLALGVAALVVFGGRWLYHVVHKKKVTVTPAGNSTPANPPAANTTTPATPQPSGSAQSSTPATTQTGQLPNNGPGDVVAIFALTAVAVGGLHYIVSLRRG